MGNTGKTQVNSALLSIKFPLKCKTLQVKNLLKCRAPVSAIYVQAWRQEQLQLTERVDNS